MAIFTTPIARVGDSNFRVGAGYKLNFYAAGTSDAKDTYTSNTYATELANPVVADGDGRFSVIWTSGDYKVVLTDADDVVIWTVDNYTTDTGSTTFAEGVLSAAGSAANVIVANLPTAPSALVDQQQVVVELQHGSNTIGNPTFNLNSLGAVVIVRDDDKPLRAGDTGGDGNKLYLSYSATKVSWQLLNPCEPSKGLGSKWVNGLAVTNGTDTAHDMDIAIGQITDDTDAMTLDLKAATTKRIDATFATGTGNGGLASGDSLADATWYGVFAIGTGAGLVDVIYATTRTKALADTVANAASYTYIQLIGAVLTYDSGGSNYDITNYVDGGDGWNMWGTGIANNTNLATVAEVIALTVSAPPFMRVLSAIQYVTSAISGYVSLDEVAKGTDAPSANDFDNYVPSGGDFITILKSLKVDGSSQVYVKMDKSGSESVTVLGSARGWKMDYSITDLV